MCAFLIPALVGVGLFAAAGNGGDCCDTGCYSACNTCGSGGYSSYSDGYGYSSTPTYAPTPQRQAAPRYSGKSYHAEVQAPGGGGYYDSYGGGGYAPNVQMNVDTSYSGW